jgi:Lrp/AsnC family transcriptional regulator, leucine-responsive regulatory protein
LILTFGRPFTVLDDTDRAIVQLLRDEGRMSYSELGRHTGLSVSAVHQRVRRLEQRGVITGYTALVSPTAIGLPVSAFIFLTELEPGSADVVATLRSLDAIDACYTVSGAASYLAYVRVADLAALETLLQQIRAAARVSSRTAVVLSTAFEHRTRTMTPSPRRAE